MWAQLMKKRLKPEKQQDLAVFRQLHALETTRVGSASDDDHEGSERLTSSAKF
jgi:hypothetical protein